MENPHSSAVRYLQGNSNGASSSSPGITSTLPPSLLCHAISCWHSFSHLHDFPTVKQLPYYSVSVHGLKKCSFTYLLHVAARGLSDKVPDQLSLSPFHVETHAACSPFLLDFISTTFSTCA